MRVVAAAPHYSLIDPLVMNWLFQPCSVAKGRGEVAHHRQHRGAQHDLVDRDPASHEDSRCHQGARQG